MPYYRPIFLYICDLHCTYTVILYVSSYWPIIMTSDGLALGTKIHYITPSIILI